MAFLLAFSMASGLSLASGWEQGDTEPPPDDQDEKAGGWPSHLPNPQELDCICNPCTHYGVIIKSKKVYRVKYKERLIENTILKNIVMGGPLNVWGDENILGLNDALNPDSERYYSSDKALYQCCKEHENVRIMSGKWEIEVKWVKDCGFQGKWHYCGH